MIESWNKLIGIIIVGAGTVFLGSNGVLDPQTVALLLGSILGYVFGNGHGVISGKNIVNKAMAKEEENAGR